MRRITRSSLQLILAAGLVGTALTAPQPGALAAAPVRPSKAVTAVAAHGTSRPLTTLPASRQTSPGHPALQLPAPSGGTGISPSLPTPPQKAPTGHAFTGPAQNFEGLGHGIAGFVGAGTPPDNNSDVSPTQIVEVVNSSVAVFSKTGSVLAGPVDTKALFSTLTSTSCSTHNDGDGVVRYDALANRWFIAQFAIPTVYGEAGPNYECVAVSQTGDATGAYNVYAFADLFNGLPDYGKFGVWSDGYYATFNEFDAPGNNYLGAVSCVYDRARMLAGQAATEQCFNLGTSYFSLLPADLEGATPPPAGAPNYQLALGSYYAGSSLFAWRFHTDWATPANSQILASPSIAVAAYNAACNTFSRNECIPEPTGGHLLESLGDRLLFPLAYRSFGADGMLTVSHSINSGTTTGERWYQIAVAPGDKLSLAQQGTFAPTDGQFRFMGSITSNRANDLALGYSTSSSSTFPDIRYTGRLATDPAGTMTQTEQTIFSGTGYETTYGRWGDYTSMDIDPADDCTFWYTNEYYTPGATYTQWNTRIASFSNPTCSLGNFGLSLSSASGSTTGGQASTTVNTTGTGSPGTIALSVSGLPSGASASFDQPSVAAGGSAALTIHAGTAAAGTYPLVVTGQSPSARHSVAYSLTITNDFGVTVTPGSGVASAPGSLTATVGSTLVSGSAATLQLSVSGAPTGATTTLASTLAMGSSTTLTVNPGSAAAGDYPLVVTATDTRPGGNHHTATYQLSIRPDFSVALSPTSGTAPDATAVTTTVTTTPIFGGAAPLTLSVTGLPAGAGASFSPATVNAGGTSLLSIDPGTAANGTYPLTVTAHNASGGGVDRTAPFALVISRETTPPVVTLSPLAPVTLTGTGLLSWTGSDPGSGVASYDVRTMTSRPTGSLGGWVTPAAWQHLTSTTVPLAGLPLGSTACYSVRATDNYGNVSGWTAPTCTIRPLDDRALKASAHWTRKSGSGWWNRTVTASKTKGAALSFKHATVTRLGIVASTCPTCGKVNVFVGTHRVGTISLKGAKAKRRLLLLPAFPARSGTVKLVVRTTGKVVMIDGLIAGRF